ncbi:MAG TPA: hypothetical protein VF766_08030 [Pyrinomonadaceae bacterium]
MDESTINGAAIEAIRDLEIDCEIKEVRQAGSGDEWCIQFSGKYGQFCDEFKNQFGKESSSQVIREKIKSHLIKAVNKIRSGTGRKRKPMGSAGSERPETDNSILSAPLKMVGEVFDRVTSIAGTVISQASNVADSARDVVADVASNISPVTIEVRSTTREVRKRVPAKSARKKTVKARRATSVKAKTATKHAARGAGIQAKKASKAARKAAVKAKKAKTTKKRSSRVK